jgi:CheY-like chemotaxis protein
MAMILCIDDDNDVIESCKMTLEQHGHTVYSANSGTEGYQKASEVKPELILLDVMMDDETDGFQTAYKLRKDEELRYIPILMLTSVNQITGLGFHQDEKGKFLPVDEFIEKPMKPTDLLATVSRMLKLTKEQINVDGQKR